MNAKLPEPIKIALEAAGESAQRSRIALLFLVTACVLAFMAFWNTLPWSWIHIRQKQLTAAVDNWSSTNQTSDAFQGSKQFVKTKFENDKYGSDSNLLTRLQKLREEVDGLESREVRYVKISFFGMGFDVNDLGLFSGISFSVLLMILAFSMRREVRNIKYYFDLIKTQADEGQGEQKNFLQLTYNLLAMRQVVTLPPIQNDDDSSTISIGWRFLQWLPFIAPFALELAILIEDFCTFQIGQAWDLKRSLLLIGFDSGAVIIVGVLTMICISERTLMYQEWCKAYRKAFCLNPVEDVPQA